jgi:hypothetical protein
MEKGPFTAFVKTGETWQTSQPKYDGRFFVHKSRPRGVYAPSGEAPSVYAAVQSLLFPSISKAEPRFIIGLNSQKMAKRFMDNMPTDAVAISIDGSAFETT